MDRTSVIITVYLCAYPVFAALMVYAAYKRRSLRFRNENSRMEWLKVWGEGIIFNWRTLLWVYLLTRML